PIRPPRLSRLFPYTTSSDLFIARAQGREELLNLFVASNVAAKRLSARKFFDQPLGFLFQAFILISNGQLHAGCLQLLRDRPRNAALIGDSKDNRSAALEIDHVRSFAKPHRIAEEAIAELPNCGSAESP